MKVHTHPVELYKTLWRKEWRWRIKAKNGRVIASASEGYKNKQDCLYNMNSTAQSLDAFIKEHA